MLQGLAPADQRPTAQRRRVLLGPKRYCPGRLQRSRVVRPARGRSRRGPMWPESQHHFVSTRVLVIEPRMGDQGGRRRPDADQHIVRLSDLDQPPLHDQRTLEARRFAQSATMPARKGVRRGEALLGGETRTRRPASGSSRRRRRRLSSVQRQAGPGATLVQIACENQSRVRRSRPLTVRAGPSLAVPRETSRHRLRCLILDSITVNQPIDEFRPRCTQRQVVPTTCGRLHSPSGTPMTVHRGPRCPRRSPARTGPAAVTGALDCPLVPFQPPRVDSTGRY